MADMGGYRYGARGLGRAHLDHWRGFGHARFEVDHVLEMKKRIPEAKIVVHPECTQEVITLADAVGSTSYIVKYVENAPSNTTVLVGTEVNLVNRLALENPDKKVLDLHYSLCPNMFKINPKNLLQTLEKIGQVNVVKVPETTKIDARTALNRMLDLAPKAT
ncbi:MAG: quinolinate synthase NadA [Desulfobacteraceae bacterium]|nr:quinolinate synthase NadA [Desulfobacteraceae bacterium]